MRRITIWLAATLAVVAMAVAYQVSLSGDGKAGEADGQRPVACGAPRAQTATTDAPRISAAPSADDNAGDPCASSSHTEKPGEGK
jgi:hypothetical protein